MYQALHRWFLAFISLFVCAQFGSQSNLQEGRQKPSINIRGTIVDASGNQLRVENITISGRITDVVVYQQPHHEKVSPDLNKTEIDLRAVRSIITLSKNYERYNDRDYIALDIVANNPRATIQTYLIEASRRLTCDDAEGIGNKSISFMAIKEVHIEGFGAQGITDPQRCPDRGNEPLFNQDLALTKTMHILEKMETTAQQLSATDASDGSLRFTLIKLIEDLKQIVAEWFS